MKAGKLFRTRKGMLLLLGILLLVVGIIWSSLQTASKHRNIKSVQIIITPDSAVYFITQNDISELITLNGGSPIGKSLSDVNLARIENAIRKMPYTEWVQVYSGLDGKLKITVKQRIPIARITNSAGEEFYLDSTGMKMPYKPGTPINVLVVNGNIQERLKDSVRVKSYTLKQILELSRFISRNPFWNAQFEQCYVDNFGELILVPRVGSHSIAIGSTENLAEKMENLRIFYDKALKSIGWDNYRIINLKYKNQVVGVKDGAENEQQKTQIVQ